MNDGILYCWSYLKRAIPHSPIDKVHKSIGLEEKKTAATQVDYHCYHRNSHTTLIILCPFEPNFQ